MAGAHAAGAAGQAGSTVVACGLALRAIRGGSLAGAGADPDSATVRSVTSAVLAGVVPQDRGELVGCDVEVKVVGLAARLEGRAAGGPQAWPRLGG